MASKKPCVAREYAFLERREDTFAPASSTHVLNLLPLLWLQKTADSQAVEGTETNSDLILAGCQGRIFDGPTT